MRISRRVRARLGSRRSLRTRITLVASLIIATAITGGVTLLYLQQMNSVRHNVDTQLRTYATQLALAAPTGDWPHPLPDSPLTPAAAAQVIAADDTVLTATRSLTGVAATFALPPGSDAPIRLKGAKGVVPDDVHVIGLHEMISGQPVTIIASVPTGLLSDINSQFTSGLFLGFPIVLVIAAAAVWILVGRTLRPVARIRHAVTDITSADLSRRVPEPGTADEIGHLAETMNQMLDRLEDSARRQRRFVADASHELRSPLAAMRTTLEVALAHPDLAQWPAVVGKAVDQTRRLQCLTQDLLLLVKADARTLAGRQQTVDVNDLVREVVAGTAAHDITIGLDLGEDAFVLGNHADLGRVLRNVLDNAVRYAEASITVTAAPDAVGAEGICIHVVDDGPGVAAEDRDRVFDRFVRLDASRDRASGSSGLGLAIAREIVSAHHGRIWFADTAGPGAHVVIHLPRPSTIMAPQVAPRPTPRPTLGRRPAPLGPGQRIDSGGRP
jgi:signal transduction histidine kinase